MRIACSFTILAALLILVAPAETFAGKSKGSGSARLEKPQTVEQFLQGQKAPQEESECYITCSNGRQAITDGNTGGQCVADCEAFCGESCTLVS
jgi:hypothetical protein